MDAAFLQGVVEGLHGRREAWGSMPPERRAALLRECLVCTGKVAEAWARASAEHRGLDPDSNLAGEEMLDGPCVLMRLLRLMAESWEGRVPHLPARVSASGRTVVRVFPHSPLDKVLWAGYTGEVWIRPGRSPERIGPWTEPRPPARVALVLGAGNITSIATSDALHVLYAENSVVVLKLNPVVEQLQPVLEQALAPLVREGFLVFVRGGAEEGAFLAHHPLVEFLHMTGSQFTYDALVWGATPEEQAARRAEGRPLLDKPFSAELGCVSPLLVVPGPWSEGDLAYQARHVAGMIFHNAGFDCLATQVLVTDRRWPLRTAFLNRVRRELANLPSRPAYYPGARDRYSSLVELYPQAEALGRGEAPALPWTLIPDVPAREGEPALQREAFCGLLFECPLEAGGARSFLDTAVDFVNERIQGNLSCTVLVHPRTARQQAAPLASALERLRYGAIGVNAWPGAAFGLMELPWGAAPGNPREDISSGDGFVHNAYGFAHPEKTVLRGPFRTPHVPPWFPGHPNLWGVARALCAVEVRPRWPAAVQVGVETLRAGLFPGGL